MSRYFSDKYSRLVPYTPGEQPTDMKYIKLNTNESPFPPPQAVVDAAKTEAAKLNLYSDPECRSIIPVAAERFGIGKDSIVFTNGSDEILNFAFMAYCDDKTPAVFADITYGFYPVFADINNLPTKIIPLEDDFTIDITKYFGVGGTIFIANPNAPTGIALSREQIEEIVRHNPDNIVVVDEAYVDYGAESCIPLTKKYDNILVTGTFSKSRSLAGARLGFGIACPSLIADMNTVRFSTNPYNINRMTMACGIASLQNDEYNMANCRTIAANREYTVTELKKLGFILTDSMTNFVFACHPDIDGEELYLSLKERGILIRHFKTERIKEYNRITIGTLEQMKAFIAAVTEILEEKK